MTTDLFKVSKDLPKADRLTPELIQKVKESAMKATTACDCCGNQMSTSMGKGGFVILYGVSFRLCESCFKESKP